MEEEEISITTLPEFQGTSTIIVGNSMEDIDSSYNNVESIFDAIRLNAVVIIFDTGLQTSPLLRVPVPVS